MPITASDLTIHLSGGAANSDVSASLGGAISSTELVQSTDGNLFDLVSGDETSAGDTEYRCYYFKNSHGSLTAVNVKVFVQANTPSPDTSVEIALGSSGVNGTEQTVADESTAPTGVTFGAADGVGNALTAADIPAGQHLAVWVKRIVSTGAAAYNSDQVQIRLQVDSGA